MLGYNAGLAPRLMELTVLFPGGSGILCSFKAMELHPGCFFSQEILGSIWRRVDHHMYVCISGRRGLFTVV